MTTRVRFFLTYIPTALLLACGGDDAQTNSYNDALAGAPSSAVAGSSGAKAPRWVGTQSCDGGTSKASIKRTSTEATIAIGDYTKTTTRARVVGIDVGPSDEYSCTGQTIETLVTKSDSTGISFDTDDQMPCSSPAGHALVIGRMHGHDFVSPIPNSVPSSLDFTIRLTEATDEERAKRSLDDELKVERVEITCTFSFELK